MAKVVEKDFLTNLPNRRSLYQHYSEIEGEAVLHAMFLDVDNFKRVNDVYGHSMGDKLLICVSNYLQEKIEGFISRIGGDEFVILIDGSRSAEDIVKDAETLLEHFHEMDFRRDILSLVSLSIGIILNQNTSQSLDDILGKCDTAMYQVKYSGKNRYKVYEAQDTIFETSRRIEAEMEEAIANGEFVVYLQPKVNMISSELRGAEALSRWLHPVDGLRPPLYYIPIFEKNGFISQLDLYVFEEVCRIKASWTGLKYEHIPISINMSRLHLYDKNFPNVLEEIAGRYNIPTKELEIEITESTFVKDSFEMIERIVDLRKKGFLVSIDDFGSGFSALALLKDMPVDTIKIDKGFLQNSTNDLRGKMVVRNVIAMCKDLKMDVVTEGIETKEQVDFISSCGCQIAQGFYYSRPVPVDEFIKYADEYLSNPLDHYTFRLNGDLKSEDGGKEGIIVGEGLHYEQGIFEDSKSLFFPGGEMEHNVVEIPPNSIVSDSFTISLWVKPKVNRFWTAAMYAKYESGFFAVVPNSWEGVSDFRIRDSKEVNGWYDATGCQFRENEWTNFAVTYNAKTEKLVTFINGDVVSTMENVPTNRFVKRIMLGGDVFQPSFEGNICELVIYNEAKDYDFIKDLHFSYVFADKFTAFLI